MRPEVEAGRAGGADGSPAADLLTADAGVDTESGDFLRGGNLLSVAAEKQLEVDSEVGLHHLLSFAARFVAEDKVVLGRLTEGGRQVEIHLSVVRAIG
jgi:hypothetical protein